MLTSNATINLGSQGLQPKFGQDTVRVFDFDSTVKVAYLHKGVNLDRSEYPVLIVVNNRQVKRVLIDPHYKQKHLEIADDFVGIINAFRVRKRS